MTTATGEPRIDHGTDSDVELVDINDTYGRVIIVRNVGSRHYVIRIHPRREEHAISVNIDLAWSDKHPSQLANYTPRYEDQSSEFAPGEVTVSDDGLLCAMERVITASHVVLHRGWSLQLPLSFVEPLRKAVALAEEAVSPLAHASPPLLRQPTADETAGIEWWNSLSVTDRAHWLAEAGSAVVADAWAAYKRSAGC